MKKVTLKQLKNAQDIAIIRDELAFLQISASIYRTRYSWIVRFVTQTDKKFYKLTGSIKERAGIKMVANSRK